VQYSFTVVAEKHRNRQYEQHHLIPPFLVPTIQPPKTTHGPSKKKNHGVNPVNSAEWDFSNAVYQEYSHLKPPMSEPLTAMSEIQHGNMILKKPYQHLISAALENHLSQHGDHGDGVMDEIGLLHGVQMRVLPL
jgi:hypothetical protein